MQIDVSRYTVESLFLTLFESNRLHVLLTNDIIPPTSAFSLTTTSLDVFLPGLVAKFGNDVPMTILIAAKEYPLAIFTPESMGGSISLSLDFQVEG